jgi:peroxiredoxin
MSRTFPALLALGLAACGAVEAPPANQAANPGAGSVSRTAAPLLRAGTWRAEVEHYGRRLPFTFEVEYGPDGPQVTYLNGPERMPVEQVIYDGGEQLELAFPSYSATLVARVGDGRLAGEIILARRERELRLPITAVHGQDWRFFPEPAVEYADFSGRWEVEIAVPAMGFTQPAMALLTQEGPMIHGTVLTQVGDFRFLAGEVRGNRLYLSAFDGGGTQQWLAELASDGMLAGSFDSVTYGNAGWTARRNPDFELEDPLAATYLKPGYDRVEFSFPDLDGNLVSLSDERYQHKVVLVVIGGSWCPSCHDEARFMVPFQAEYADRGLEVVYVMFEYSDDFSQVERQLRAFRDRYDISYPVLFAGDSSRQTRGELIPALNDIVAFPTTLFIDRRGKVRRIHTAFPGQATGQLHQDYVRELRSFVGMLLDEDSAG